MTTPEGRITGDRSRLLSAVVPHAVLERTIAEYLVAPAPLPERSSFGASPRCLLKADVIKGQRSDIPSSDPRSYLAARNGGWMPALAVLVAPFPPHRQLALHRTVVVHSDHDMAALTAASLAASDSGVESLMVCGRGVARDALEQLRSNGPLLSALTSLSIDPEACPELFPIPPSLRSYRRLVADRAFEAFDIDRDVSDEDGDGDEDEDEDDVEESSLPRGHPETSADDVFDTDDDAAEKQRILRQRSTTRTLMQIVAATPHLTRLDVPLCPEPLLVIRGIKEQRQMDVPPTAGDAADIAPKRSRSGDQCVTMQSTTRAALGSKVPRVLADVTVCGLTSLTLRTGDPSRSDHTIRSWCMHEPASSVHFSPRAVRDILAHLPLLESLDVCLSLCDSPYSPEIIAAVTGPHCAVDIPYLCGGEDMAGTADISDHDVWHMHVAMANHAHRLKALTFTCECCREDKFDKCEWFPFTVPHHGMRSFIVTNNDLPCGFDMARTLPNLTHLDAPFDFSEPDPDPASWPYLRTLRMRCLFDGDLIGLLVLLRHCPLVSLSLVDDITSFEDLWHANSSRPSSSVSHEMKTLLSRSSIVATLRHLHIEHWDTLDVSDTRMFTLETLNVINMEGEAETLSHGQSPPSKCLALLGQISFDPMFVQLARFGVASRLVKLDLSHDTDFDDDTDFPYLTDLGCLNSSSMPRQWERYPALSKLNVRCCDVEDYRDELSKIDGHSSLRYLVAKLPNIQSLPVLPRLEWLTVLNSSSKYFDATRSLLQWNESETPVSPQLRRCSRVCTDVFVAGGGLPPSEVYGTLEAFDSPLLRMPSLAHLSVPFLFFDPKGFAAYLCRHLEALHTVKCRGISIV